MSYGNRLVGVLAAALLAGCDMPVGDSRLRDEGYQWAAAHHVRDELACTQGAPATERARAIMEGCLQFVRQHQRAVGDVSPRAEQSNRDDVQTDFDFDSALTECADEPASMEKECITRAEELHSMQALQSMQSDAAMRQAEAMARRPQPRSPGDFKAGYAWAEQNFVTDGDHCLDGASESFAKGCLAFAMEHLGEGADDDH